MEFDGRKWTTQKILDKIGDKRVRSLALGDTSADDDLLYQLAKRGSLTSFEVVSEFITDKGIASLANQCKLRSLMIQYAPCVTDESMPAIASCSTLRELYLASTELTDQGIGLISQLPELWSLVIRDTDISDAGIQSIASQTIDLVSFEGCKITGIGFESWSNSRKMSFYGEGSDLNDEGFSVACRSFTFMWNVIVSDTNLGDRGIMSLTGDGPTMIRLRGSNVTYQGIEWLVNNIPVQSIDADSKQITTSQAKSLESRRHPLWIRVD